MSGIDLSFKVLRSKSLLPAIRKAFDDYEVTAGIHQDAGQHDNSKESVAQIAAYNEYGTATAPERPAFRASFFKNRKKYIAMLIKIARSGMKGSKLRQSAFDSLGKVAQKDIEASIAGGSWAANAESTQLAKGRGKQKINDPLIDTGQVIDSVGYKVKKK